MSNENVKRRTNSVITEIITKTVEKLKQKYIETVDPSDLDEVTRRILLLNQSYIASCVEVVSINLYSLNIGVPSVVLAAIAIRALELRIIIIPEIGASQCVFVRHRIAEILSKTITELRQERVMLLKECWQRQQQSQEAEKSTDKGIKSSKKPSVMVSEVIEIIGEASYGEFIEDLAGTAGNRRLTLFV